MKKTLFKSALLFTTATSVFVLDLPKGWETAIAPEAYEIGLAKGGGRNGSNGCTIRYVSGNPQNFGVIRQAVNPTPYKGRRVRMSGYLKTSDAEGAGFYLRTDKVDETSEKDTVRLQTFFLDNMFDRKVTGTTDWKQYHLVMDVPQEANQMTFGATLSGKGQMRFDDISLEIVDEKVPVTFDVEQVRGTVGGLVRSKYRGLSSLKTPTNLKFEE